MLAPLLALATLLPTMDRPLDLHPDNPHYFLFRGRPAVLVTSGEHYGAVLNRDFDFAPYLDELQARGFNLTRTFSGTYREVPGSFRIRDNTLAPAPGRYVGPWARAGDGEKFDLDRWDDSYFRRLKQFLAAAGRRGIVVELVLFCPLYEEAMWDVSPMNARNNVNGVGRIPRTEALTLKHPDLVARHVAFVRKIVAELRDFDNLYYEVCNEPYFGGVTRAWQDRIIATIVEAEREYPFRHLIAQNISKGQAKISDPNAAVSVFNFHYARPPETVALNYALNKPIGDDETGFQGTADRPYRTEGWDFLVAGGSVYSNLDYSFTATHEDGTAAATDPTPGGGGPSLRGQLAILKRFLEGFEFLRMAPDNAVIRGGVPSGATARALVERGKQYAIYVNGGTHTELALDLPAGRYRAEWVSPRTGAVDRAEDLDHPGGRVVLESPPYAEDIALRVMAPPALTSAAFQGWFEAAVRGRLRIPEPVEQRARRFRYVFVGGFDNERMPGYFAQNAQELRALGVPRPSIHFLYPSSRRTVEQNADVVRDELRRIAGAGRERLVIIAHSRGACDALAFALRDPPFVRDRVKAMFLVQGPFGGSGLADYVLGEGAPMDGRMPPGHRLLAHLLGRREKALLERGRHAGLVGLTREESRAYWRRALEDHADAIPMVGPKAYFIESRARPARLRLFLRATAWYLRTYYGPNDGVVALGDQALPGLGTHLGTLEAGHADLTRRFPATRSGRRARQALVRSIVMAVGRPEVEQ